MSTGRVPSDLVGLATVVLILVAFVLVLCLRGRAGEGPHGDRSTSS